MLDLLHTSARLLAIEGVLVYLIPTTYDFTIDDLPKHPCFTIDLVCHQMLSGRHGRRAVVMRKKHLYSTELQQSFMNYKQNVIDGNDQGFGLLMPKLEQALAADAYENENVKKIYSNIGQKRQLRKREKIARRKEIEKNSENTISNTNS